MTKMTITTKREMMSMLFNDDENDEEEEEEEDEGEGEEEENEDEVDNDDGDNDEEKVIQRSDACIAPSNSASR